MAASATPSTVKTRFLVLSDTHGREVEIPPESEADVAINCGDLTAESQIEEFRSAIKLLQSIKAPLKLVIAGNHDFTLDDHLFRRKMAGVPSSNLEMIKREYGGVGEARELFEQDEVKQSGIVLLDEGTHTFTLANGAALKVYASPYTPSFGDWAFQYLPETGHEFDIANDVDVAMTHGPPNGVMDMTRSKERAGSSGLFEAIARSRPQMHCFGHIHEAWGAKFAAWRPKINKKPTHFSDIDNGESKVVSNLSQVDPGTQMVETSHCIGDEYPLQSGSQTLFLNAAVKEGQPLWLVDLELPQA